MPTTRHWPLPDTPARTGTPRIAIVGAGASGICLGVRLRQAGIESFTIFEKGSSVGGTWRDNTYPGLMCDVPSRYYSFSFAPRPDWSQVFAPGHEIRDYLEDVTDAFGVRPFIRFDTAVESTTWVDDRWEVRLADGTVEVYDVVVSATGVLRDPKIPDIPGLEEFGGRLFHSARWDHDAPIAGQRVGVVGTGSTGVQIVTALASVADHVSLFLRRPHWVLALPSLSYTPVGRWLHRTFPSLGRLAHRGWQRVFEETMSHAATRPGLRRRLVGWLCRACLRTVRDRELREQLTPTDDPLCKRLIISGGFYREVQRDSVDVVTDGIDRIVPEGVRTVDGTVHELDVLVLATGFHSQRYMRPMAVVGEDGRSLDDAWASGPHSYRTVAMPGFPNFFLLQGPHSPVANQSLIQIAETQADWVLQCIELIGERDVAIAPTQEATDAFLAELSAEMPQTAWASGCDSWYLDEHGNPTVWPFLAPEHRTALARPELDDFHVRPRRHADAPVTASTPS